MRTCPAVMAKQSEATDFLLRQMGSELMIGSQMSFYRDRMSSITRINGTYWRCWKWKADGLKLAFGRCTANDLFQG